MKVPGSQPNLQSILAVFGVQSGLWQIPSLSSVATSINDGSFEGETIRRKSDSVDVRPPVTEVSIHEPFSPHLL